MKLNLEDEGTEITIARFCFRYEGDTGLIVRVQENMIVLFSDLTMHELKVLPKDLQLCTDMATGVDALGQFQFGDMVQIDPQTVGVIVQIQKENFQVRKGEKVIGSEMRLQSTYSLHSRYYEYMSNSSMVFKNTHKNTIL